MIFFTLIAAFVQQASLKCAFTVTCPTCLPIPVDDEPIVVDVIQSCPFFNGKEVCCNGNQDIQMMKNFQAIDATFGSGGAGCDVYCGANLKRFWCEYTCSPRQQEFMTVGDYTIMPDPLAPSQMVEVQLNQLRIHPDTACQFWQSCKRTQFASQVSAMQTPGGFFNFQGENAVSQGKQYITSIFLDDPATTLNLTGAPLCNYTADSTKLDPFGFELKVPCSCNNCDLACSADIILYEPTGVFYGFNLTMILSVWGGVLLVAIGVTIAKFKMKKKSNTDYHRVGFQDGQQGQ